MFIGEREPPVSEKTTRNVNHTRHVPFLEGIEDAKIGPRNTVNWTLPNAKKSFATVGGSQKYVHDVTRTGDIDGAHASTTKKYSYSHRFANKPSFFSPADIEGSHPKQQVPQKVHGFAAASGKDRALCNRDIEHCYPESKLFATPRIVNPLNPVYNLPPCKHHLPEPEKPKRDPLSIDDIEGTHAKKAKHFNTNRNTLDTHDIELSTAGSASAARKRKSTSRMMETRDITHPPELEVEPFLKNPRGTNPLNPVYKLSAPTSTLMNLPEANRGKPLIIGDVEGSHPKARVHERKDRPSLSLKANDILGARPKHLCVIRQYQYDEKNGGTSNSYNVKKNVASASASAVPNNNIISGGGTSISSSSNSVTRSKKAASNKSTKLW